MRLSGAPSVLANARSSPGFGRSAGFLNAVAAARQEQREPAQHVLGAASGAYPRAFGAERPKRMKPAHGAPDVEGLSVNPLTG